MNDPASATIIPRLKEDGETWNAAPRVIRQLQGHKAGSRLAGPDKQRTKSVVRRNTLQSDRNEAVADALTVTV